jgi:2'-5' RNA ligase
MTLTEQLKLLALPQGLPVDERPFKPHITLSRKARTALDLGFEPIVWQTNSFCLVESLTQPEGAVYRVLRTFR